MFLSKLQCVIIKKDSILHSCENIKSNIVLFVLNSKLPLLQSCHGGVHGVGVGGGCSSSSNSRKKSSSSKDKVNLFLCLTN
jgi:hypothetical protein